MTWSKPKIGVVTEVTSAMESKSREQKRFVIGLVLSLLLGTPTSLLSLDRKRRSHICVSHMRNHKAVLTRS